MRRSGALRVLRLECRALSTGCANCCSLRRLAWARRGLTRSSWTLCSRTSGRPAYWIICSTDLADPPSGQRCQCRFARRCRHRLQGPMPAAVGPTSPPAQGAEPTAFPVPAQTATRPAPANMPALPNALHDSAATPVKAGHSHKRTIGLSAIAAGTAAAVALAALSTQLITPPLTVAALQQDGAPGTQPATASTSTPFYVGPTLAAPATLQEPNANALYDQALIIGAQDSLAAAIGFARAALRGDARSAFYLGQHFEAGDECATQCRARCRVVCISVEDTARRPASPGRPYGNHQGERPIADCSAPPSSGHGRSGRALGICLGCIRRRRGALPD